MRRGGGHRAGHGRSTRVNKRYLTLAAVAVVLAALASLQFRTWRDFDWATFVRYTGDTRKLYLLAALAVIFSDYYFRALRWKLLLRPVKDVSAGSLLASQVIGFTAIGVLGRPGDLVRPYLVARRESLPLTSQIAVLAVERVFDTGAFAILLVTVAFGATLNLSVDRTRTLQFGALAILLGVVGFSFVMFVIWKYDEPIMAWIDRRYAAKHPGFASALRHKVKHFSDGLHTIHDAQSFLVLFMLSIWIWLMIALAYWLVTQAYNDPALHYMQPARVFLLMAGSVAGSLLQLPMVGGGSQLGTIGVLHGLFNVQKELATSCGIMLWLITFMAIVPIGLIWSRFEHLNLKQVSEESEAEAADE
jgi:glycosyltransferase 2 family protein